MEVIILALVMDTYVYTWFPGSRTRLGHFRMCVYREYRPVIDCLLYTSDAADE